MVRVVPCLLAVVLSGPALAEEKPTARAVFRKAVAAQGSLPGQEIRDITLRFRGQIVEGRRINTVERLYRYRARDRSFRVQTASRASAKIRSERGVFGESGFWERAADGRILTLRRGNREDAASIKTIGKDREDFERMLRMVLLARLDDGKTQLTLSKVSPLRLEHDMPYAAVDTLGKDRKEHTYHVLDMQREGQPKLRLFIHTGTYTVRKVVQFDRQRADERRWFYYFGPYRKDPATNLTLPLYFSVYDGLPVDEQSMKARNRVRGEPKITLNAGLADTDLRPAS
ncbi:MAG: hypothetical protein ACYTEZ_12920 [Planctomycetota bacterium]|jgi:hypothetical protein